MLLTVPVDPEAKKEVGECPVDRVMRVMNAECPVTSLERSRWRGRRFACYAPGVVRDDRVAVAVIYFPQSLFAIRYMIEIP
jgi:hypothetical protein